VNIRRETRNLLIFYWDSRYLNIGGPWGHKAGQFPITTRFWVGLRLMGAAAWWILVVKGGLKKLIGEPFFFEFFGQTLQKEGGRDALPRKGRRCRFAGMLRHLRRRCTTKQVTQSDVTGCT
jgi:hypothetical protein